MRVEESIQIGRTPEQVWTVIADPVNDPRWCPKVRSVEPAGPGRWTVVHKPVPLRPPMTLDVRQLALEAPARVTLREEDEASVFDVEYLLEPAPGGTRFTQISDFEWKRLPVVLHAVFAHGVRRDLRRQLRGLKELLEAS